MRGQPLRAAVVGHPISHSQSPAIHGHWLEMSGIAGRYGLFDFDPADFDREIRALAEQGYQGVNVTVPFKEAALAMADSTEATAQRIGAANTLVFERGRISARNTDAYGFWENLRSGLSNDRRVPDRAVVFGAGGAARAVLVALQAQGVNHIWLANRTLSRAQGLADELAAGAMIEAMSWTEAEDMLDREAVPLIINTSSRGMKGENPITARLAAQGPETLVNDIVYNPLKTKLLETAAAQGSRTIDGLGMLLHQARPAFEAFFGGRVVVDDTLRQKIEHNMGLV